jgi:predicted RNA methylase
MFNMSPGQDPFSRWSDALEQRHLAHLNFAEVRRGVQALSSLYVERRDRIARGSALDGAGKRAAFAFFFSPLHFLLVQNIVRGLGALVPVGPVASHKTILDLGCGTGSAGAAWALEMKTLPAIKGVDRNPWVLQEAKFTYQALGLRGTVRSADVTTISIPPDTAVISAFTMNELESSAREKFLTEFIRASRRGSSVLIVEPIARRLTSWWDNWAREVTAAGGMENSWRFPVKLPERLALMDRAAGLVHRELTGRSLWLPEQHATIGPHDLLSKMRTPE